MSTLVTDVPNLNSEKASFPSQKQPECETTAGIQQLPSLLKAEKTKFESFNWNLLGGMQLKGTVQSKIKNLSFAECSRSSSEQ